METQKEFIQPISPSASTPPSNSVQIPGVLETFQNALAFYKSRWKTLLGITLIPFILTFVIAFSLKVGSTALKGLLEDSLAVWAFIIPATLLVSVFLIIVYVWQFLALLFIIKDKQEGIGIKEAYKRAWFKIKSCIWISFLSSSAIFAGSLFFLVPGMIFAVWFYFSTYVLVDEGLTGIQAMKKSQEYVKGNFWAVVWRIFAFALFSFAIWFGVFLLLIIPNIVLGFISPKLGEIFNGIVSAGASLAYTPFVVIYSYLVYQGLKISKSQPADGQF